MGLKWCRIAVEWIAPTTILDTISSKYFLRTGAVRKSVFRTKVGDPRRCLWRKLVINSRPNFVFFRRESPFPGKKVETGTKEMKMEKNLKIEKKLSKINSRKFWATFSCEGRHSSRVSTALVWINHFFGGLKRRKNFFGRCSDALPLLLQCFRLICYCAPSLKCSARVWPRQQLADGWLIVQS